MLLMRYDIRLATVTVNSSLHLLSRFCRSLSEAKTSHLERESASERAATFLHAVSNCFTAHLSILTFIRVHWDAKADVKLAQFGYEP